MGLVIVGNIYTIILPICLIFIVAFTIAFSKTIQQESEIKGWKLGEVKTTQHSSSNNLFLTGEATKVTMCDKSECRLISEESMEGPVVLTSFPSGYETNPGLYCGRYQYFHHPVEGKVSRINMQINGGFEVLDLGYFVSSVALSANGDNMYIVTDKEELLFVSLKTNQQVKKTRKIIDIPIEQSKISYVTKNFVVLLGRYEIISMRIHTNKIKKMRIADGRVGVVEEGVAFADDRFIFLSVDSSHKYYIEQYHCGKLGLIDRIDALAVGKKIKGFDYQNGILTLFKDKKTVKYEIL